MSGQGSGRAVFHVSSDADPLAATCCRAVIRGDRRTDVQGDWGGTSFVAPQLNGSTAVIDSYLGHPVGLLNPNL